MRFGTLSTGTWDGALSGAFTAVATFGIDISGIAANFAAATLAKGVVGGISAELQGGKFGHGFLSSGVTAAVSLVIQSLGQNKIGQIIASAVVGGTVSELSRGKFANGAATAAMQFAISTALGQAASRNRPGLGSGNASPTSELPLEDRVSAFEKRTNELVADGTLSRARVFSSPDDAAKEVLSVTAPLSREFGLEVGGNILPTSRGKVFQYTIPVVGTEINEVSSPGVIGYHTHPSGALRFSNKMIHVNSDAIDTVRVEKTGFPLYLGVHSASGITGIAVCEPGICSHIEYGGTRGQVIQ
ncbi:MAG: hypothetical protein Kow0020_15870 [Wenzhouxiangellaceae bacterium]